MGQPRQRQQGCVYKPRGREDHQHQQKLCPGASRRNQPGPLLDSGSPAPRMVESELLSLQSHQLYGQLPGPHTPGCP